MSLTVVARGFVLEEPETGIRNTVTRIVPREVTITYQCSSMDAVSTASFVKTQAIKIYIKEEG